MRTSAQLRQDRAAAIAEAREVRTQMEAADAPSDELSGRFNDAMTRAEALAVEIANADALEARFGQLDAFNAADVEPRRSNPLPHQDSRHDFSVAKAIREAARGNLSGLEAEVAQEMGRRYGLELEGNSFVLPYDLRSGETRSLTSSNSGGGIATDVATNILDYLRGKLVISGLGATVFGNLTGEFAVPKATAASNAGWAAEGSAFSASSPTIGQVLLQPSRVGTYVEYSKTMLRQTSADVEAFLRNDLAAAVAQAIDAAAINGSGSSNEPEGILQNSSVTKVAIGTNGGDPTLSTVVGLESAVDTANALAGNLAYVTSPAGRGKLKTIPTATNFGQFLLDYQTGLVNGYQCMASPHVPTDLTKGTGSNLTALIFGDWSGLYVGMWGGAIVTVNPYSLDTSGMVRITIEQMADVKIRHTASFAFCSDMAKL